MMRLLVSAAAIALLSSAALAADIPMEEALPAPVEAVPAGWDWSGLYGGAFAGYGWADVDVDDKDGYNEDGVSYNVDDFYFGSLFGYNHQIGHFVLGIEGEVGRLEFEDSEQADFPNDLPGVDRRGDSIASIDVDTFGNVSGRLGFAWDNWMPYVKGGLAFADVEVRFDDSNPTGGQLLSGTQNDDWLFGWTVGGGVEVGFWEKWSVRGEYMYTNLDNISVDATGTDNLGNDRDFTFDTDLQDIHTVKLAVTRRF